MQPACYPPYWMKTMNQESSIEPFHPDMNKYQYARSQELPKTIFCDGYVDAIRVESIKKYKELIAGNIYPIHLDNIYFIDIDDEKDWEYAEYIFSKN